MADSKKMTLVPDDSQEPAQKQSPADVSKSFNFAAIPGMKERFAALNHLILRDLNGTNASPTFSKYTKDQIATYLSNPHQYRKQLRAAVTYIYGASSHFRRLVQYFVGLSDLSFVVSPYKVDTSTAKPKSIRRNYQKVLNTMSALDPKNQFPKILTVCLREDVFYGTLIVSNDNITLHQLPSDYCEIATVEGNVCNVTFDFSYFDSNSQYLPFYPAEFQTKYNLYQNNRATMKWQELNSPNSFAIKCNTDILNYAIPPFAGILREIYNLEDYKALKFTREELENYAILVMKLGINDAGEWLLDYDKAVEFYRNLDGVLPEEVGAVLSPMDIEKISFNKTQTGDSDAVAESEQNLFSAAGVSSLLFNNAKASSNALLLSIKADQAITFGVVKSIEQMVNRFIWCQSYGKNFKVTFLDCSPFNRKEVGDAYLKACQSGIPMISYYASSQGLPQADLDCMNFLEKDVLQLYERLTPLKTSSTLSSSSSTTGDAGAPEKGVGEISDNGEAAKESTGDSE